MKSHDIEALAAEVIRTYRLKPPVDLQHICAEEGIQMVPGAYTRKFHGRLEYNHEVGSFLLFYPEEGTGLSLGRIRFSICHELAHYFIEEHRDAIISGEAHNSIEAFHPAKRRIEDEADTFAAALLIPEMALREYIGKRVEVPLDSLLSFAELCQASIQATIFRYVQVTDEACVAVFCKGDRVARFWSSAAADSRGFGHLGQSYVPDQSTASKCLKEEPMKMFSGHSHTGDWFSDRNYGAKLWEESVRLGQSDYTLTMLSWAEGKND